MCFEVVDVFPNSFNNRFVDKKLQFREKNSLRFKSRCRRIKSIFKKAHALVELTKCQVFVYVKDKFSKTTYWGTSDALQLFQPMIHVDSLIKNIMGWSLEMYSLLTSNSHVMG